ncbi:MAG: hypothetical protein IJ820_09105 [Lachnospiraceae bacterium]|nr:hypothetical protein [Lachnospiraceae bacterium]
MRTDTTAAERGYRYIPIAILCNILWGSAIPFINVGYRLFGIVLVRQPMDIPLVQYLAALALVCACIIMIQRRPQPH